MGVTTAISFATDPVYTLSPAFAHDVFRRATSDAGLLVSAFGASHVLLGSDYPYDMGTFECARQVKALSVPDADKATILSGLVQKLLDGVK